MNPVFIQLNQNFTTLEEQLMKTYHQLIIKNYPEIADRLLALVKDFFAQFSDLFEKFRSGKLTDIVLNFLQEIEAFLIEVYNKFSLPNAEQFENVTKLVIHAIRNQVIELDQYRQSVIAQY